MTTVMFIRTKAGDLLVTGATGTNVADVQILLMGNGAPGPA